MSAPIVLALRLMLAAALFAFLGFALWMMWKDLERTTGQVANRKIPPIGLEVWTGDHEPRSLTFNQPEIILGRDPLADVSLADQAVSARHAMLSFHHSQWWLDDLGSTNGTFLNNERAKISTVLTTGDEIRCGQDRIAIHLEGKKGQSGGRVLGAQNG